MVLAQGDTTTVLATAMASFYNRVPFGHVEAGLRTHRLDAPFPEEANRVLAGHLCTFTSPRPPRRARTCSEKGSTAGTIVVTGNTVIDAPAHGRRARRPDRGRARCDPPPDPGHGPPSRTVSASRSCQICRAIGELHDRFPDVEFLWPVHPNPSIKPVVEGAMADRPRVRLCDSLAYGPFVSAMKRATLILTDSGGVQEEAPALGKPVAGSPRGERASGGHCRRGSPTGGTRPAPIVSLASHLLNDANTYRSMARGVSPYGDGKASERIAAAVGRFLGVTDSLRAAG